LIVHGDSSTAGCPAAGSSAYAVAAAGGLRAGPVQPVV